MSSLLTQVYFGPWNPRSIKLHTSKQSLKIWALFILTRLPPHLSVLDKISLKSPSIVQAKLSSPATLAKFFQSNLCLANLGLAYIQERIQDKFEESTLTMS